MEQNWNTNYITQYTDDFVKENRSIWIHKNDLKQDHF